MSEVEQPFTSISIIYSYISAISFWGLFGGGQVAVNGTNESSAALSDELNTFYRVPVFLFRMSLIDDYPYRVCVASVLEQSLHPLSSLLSGITGHR